MEKRTKKDQKQQAKELAKIFAQIEHNKELIPVVLQRGDWEALHYSIGLALKKNAISTK